MSDSPKKLLCASHGEAFPAYVCQHLLPGGTAEWCSSRPTPDNPWPSAWCETCHEAFAKEGEWNAKSEAEADLQVRAICHRCYEAASIRARHRYLDDQ